MNPGDLLPHFLFFLFFIFLFHFIHRDSKVLARGLCNSEIMVFWDNLLLFPFFHPLARAESVFTKREKRKKNTYVKITHPHHVQKSCVWQQEHVSKAKWHFSFLAKRARKKKKKGPTFSAAGTELLALVSCCR